MYGDFKTLSVQLANKSEYCAKNLSDNVHHLRWVPAEMLTYVAKVCRIAFFRFWAKLQLQTLFALKHGSPLFQARTIQPEPARNQRVVQQCVHCTLQFPRNQLSAILSNSPLAFRWKYFEIDVFCKELDHTGTCRTTLDDETAVLKVSGDHTSRSNLAARFGDVISWFRNSSRWKATLWKILRTQYLCFHRRNWCLGHSLHQIMSVSAANFTSFLLRIARLPRTTLRSELGCDSGRRRRRASCFTGLVLGCIETKFCKQICV